VAYYQCTDGQRRSLHRSIAEVLADPEERARHLALATAGPDAEVAAALDEASRVAAGRGAPDAAAEMCELARRLTPVDDAERARGRAVRAAWCHFAAGDLPLARTQLGEVVATSPPGPARAEVLRLLGELRYHHDFVEAVELLQQALAEVGDDDRLRAAIEIDLAFAIITTSGDTVAAGARAEAGVACAERCHDPGLLAAALAVAALVDFIAGHPGAEDRMARAVAMEDPHRQHVLFNHPSFLAGLVWMWTERQADARSVFERLYRRALDEGEESALPGLGFFAACLACRMGDLDSAARYARSSVEASVNVGGDVSRGGGLTAQAMVAAHLGDVDAARAQAAEAADLFQRSASLVPVLWAVWMLGFVELSVGDPLEAHRVLDPISRLVTEYGLGEPALAPSIPDDIEALVGLGELDRAEALLGWLEERGQRLDRAWARATAGRGRALLRAAQGDLDGAVEAIEAALDQHDRIPLPLERGRTLLVKGQIERRRKHKATAKHAIEESLATFEAVGAALWAQRAKNELSRINIRPPAPLDLTATEAKVADLAAAGLSTKQVAERAFMNPRSVEGVLSRVYRKLGVASRAELANTMAARRGAPPPGGPSG
jgi:DNA-binding CsgD family transcriptional regulator